MAKDQALLSAEREKRKDLEKDFAVLKRQVAEKERMSELGLIMIWIDPTYSPLTG